MILLGNGRIAAVYPNFILLSVQTCRCQEQSGLPEGVGLPRDIYAACPSQRDDSLVVPAICEFPSFNMQFSRGRL